MSQQQQPPNWAGLILIGVILYGFYAHSTGQWPFEPRNLPDVIDDGSNDDQASPKLDGSYLVIVEESKSRPADRLMVINDYQFWGSLKGRGMAGFRLLDDDSEAAKSFIDEARKKSIESPFVMLTATDGKVLSVIPFPKSTETIEAMLK